MALDLGGISALKSTQGFLRSSESSQSGVKTFGSNSFLGKVAAFIKNPGAEANRTLKEEFVGQLRQKYGDAFADNMSTLVKPQSGKPLSVMLAKRIVDLAETRAPLKDQLGDQQIKGSPERQHLDRCVAIGLSDLPQSEIDQLGQKMIGQARSGVRELIAGKGANALEMVRTAGEGLEFLSPGTMEQSLLQLLKTELANVPHENVKAAETLFQSLMNSFVRESDPMHGVLEQFGTALGERLNQTMSEQIQNPGRGPLDLAQFGAFIGAKPTPGSDTPQHALSTMAQFTNTLVHIRDDLSTTLGKAIKDIEVDGGLPLDVLNSLHPPLTIDDPEVKAFAEQLSSSGQPGYPGYLDHAIALSVVHLMHANKGSMTDEARSDFSLQLSTFRDDFAASAFESDKAGGRVPKAGFENLLSEQLGKFVQGSSSFRDTRQHMMAMMGRSPEFSNDIGRNIGGTSFGEAPPLNNVLQSGQMFTVFNSKALDQAMADKTVQQQLKERLDAMPIGSRIPSDVGAQGLSSYLDNNVRRKLELVFRDMLKAATDGSDRNMLGLSRELQASMITAQREVRAYATILTDETFLASVPEQHRDTMRKMGEQFDALRRSMEDPGGDWRSLMRTSGQLTTNPDVRAEMMDTLRKNAGAQLGS